VHVANYRFSVSDAAIFFLALPLLLFQLIRFETNSPAPIIVRDDPVTLQADV
jgi:hypothetical protein